MQENSELKNFISKAMAYVSNHAKDVFSFIKNIFSSELTEPLLNEKEKERGIYRPNRENSNSGQIWPLYSLKTKREFLKLGVNKDYRTSFAGAKFATACLP